MQTEHYNQLASEFKSLFFIHIPKCGGSYILRVALQHEIVNLAARRWKGGDVMRAAYHFVRENTIGKLRSIGKRAYYMPHPVCTHQPPALNGFSRAWKYSCCENRYFENSLVFSVVRNPFDLLVSFYTYGFPYARAESGGPFATFADFIKAYCDESYPWIVQEQQKFLFFQLFDDRGLCRAHVILRNESLNAGLAALCRPFGIVPRCSSERVKSSRTQQERDYRRFYTDMLVELVRKKCARELQAFGYDFDGGTDEVLLDPRAIEYNVHTNHFQIHKERRLDDSFSTR